MHSRSCAIAFIFLSLSGFATGAAKQPKASRATALGLKTPGVAIPFANLKSEADITVAPPLGGVLLTDSIAVADATGVHRFDAKTNKAFEPTRDVPQVKNACGGIVTAFSFSWAAICGQPTVAKFELRSIRPAGGRGGRKGGDAKGESKGEAKDESKKGDPPAESAKAGEPKEGEQKRGGGRPPTPGPKPPAAPLFIPAGSAPIAPQAIASSGDSIWLLADDKTTLLRIDPVENTVVSQLRLPADCQSILSFENSLWVACPAENRLLRINPDKNLVEKRIETGAEPVAIASGESSVWVLLRKEGKVVRIDPKANKVIATIDIGLAGLDGTLAFGEGSLWVSTPGFPITRIDPESDKVIQQFHGDAGGRIYFGLGSLWVGGPQSATLRRFDPKLIKATLSD